MHEMLPETYGIDHSSISNNRSSILDRDRLDFGEEQRAANLLAHLFAGNSEALPAIVEAALEAMQMVHRSSDRSLSIDPTFHSEFAFMKSRSRLLNLDLKASAHAFWINDDEALFSVLSAATSRVFDVTSVKHFHPAIGQRQNNVTGKTVPRFNRAKFVLALIGASRC